MTTAFAQLGRPIRLAVVGGGPGSFIGEVHRSAARLDGRYDIAAGVVSSDPAKALAAASALGIARGYGTVEAMLAAETGRPDGIEAVAIMTPNDRHHGVATAALAHGLDVICDKPMTTTLDDAHDLVARARAAGTVFCLTHNYSGYPMVRQARAMIAGGAIGAVRAVQVEYLQAGMAARVEDGPLTPKLRWKLDATRAGPSLVLGDIGTHAHQLACYVAGAPVQALAADLGALVPGRAIDDYAAMLLRLANGARATLLASQALAGSENDLNLRVFGESGLIEWRQTEPNRLRHAPAGTAARLLARGDPDLLPAAARLTRLPRGHPEGFREAFANLYRDAAEAIAARRLGRAPDPLAEFPGVEDGARGVAFIDAAIRSRAAGGAWVNLATI